jgi:squalene-hopene cyclase-like protein
MNSLDSEKSVSAIESANAAFVSGVCVPLLRDRQNADGGWGFHPQAESRVEPTSWALLALMQVEPAGGEGEIVQRGLQYLRSAQLPDGSWPATPGEETGCWVTSLACWALSREEYGPVARGLEWLCRDWPWDSSPWQRFLRRLTAERSVSTQNDAYRGWGWTPRTSSWVEPTSFALILFGEVPETVLPSGSRRRQQLAEAMLYDRMCPGGGWNCGNPRVYGVPGEPLIIPTVWALLALRKQADRAENQMSLVWLLRASQNVQSLASLALARICIEMYGKSWPLSEARLSGFYERHEFLADVAVTAWACLAWNSRPRLFTSSGRGRA